MKKIFFLIILFCLLAGCATRLSKRLDKLPLGADKMYVKDKIGQPDYSGQVIAEDGSKYVLWRYYVSTFLDTNYSSGTYLPLTFDLVFKDVVFKDDSLILKNVYIDFDPRLDEKSKDVLMLDSINRLIK